jgi:phosphoribosyl-AMP cyclohydrolase
MKISELKFDANGLIPAIVQEARTGEVMMMAWMDKKAVALTLSTGYTHFWSRSRQKYWKKGETSGALQEVREVLYDCDQDVLLVQIIQHGKGACHTGERTCFFRKLEPADADEILKEAQ